MNNYREDYWVEALECSLDAHGFPNAICKELITAIAKDIRIAHEMHSEASGEININNPLRQELRNLEKRKDAEIAEVKNREVIYETCLAGLIGVEPRRLYINHGDVCVSRT